MEEVGGVCWVTLAIRTLRVQKMSVMGCAARTHRSHYLYPHVFKPFLFVAIRWHGRLLVLLILLFGEMPGHKDGHRHPYVIIAVSTMV